VNEERTNAGFNARRDLPTRRALLASLSGRNNIITDRMSMTVRINIRHFMVGLAAITMTVQFASAQPVEGPQDRPVEGKWYDPFMGPRAPGNQPGLGFSGGFGAPPWIGTPQ
jgi:hypothetical protein